MGYDFSCTTEIKNARRQRKCHWCLEILGPNRIKQAGVWMEDFGVIFYHLECWEALNKSDEDFEDGIEEGAHKRGSVDYKDNY